MDILYTYHPGWILLAFLLALLYAFGLYFREKVLVDMNKTLKLGLGFIRFFSVFLISLLLIGIILEGFKSEKEKPLLFIAQDNTESIVQNKDSSYYRIEYINDIDELTEKLNEKFEVIPYSFSDVVTNGLEIDFSDKITDISSLLNHIYDQYNNRNIGAIVLSSDGIYNQGANPVYTVSRKPHVPVFTIGMGDTATLKDVFISEVIHNKIAFLGNQFPVEINIGHEGYKGESITIKIFEKEKQIFSKKVELEKTNGAIVLPVNLEAKATGFRKYTVKISELDGELTFKNNSSNFYINVIDGRQKILLTYSGIHPDISAINYVIEQNKNYELTIESISEINGDLGKYDLIIIHNYQNKNKQLEELVRTNAKPILYLIGTNSDVNTLAKSNIGFSGNGGNSEDITFLGNTKFNEILYGQDVFKTFENAPPLRSPIGSINFSPSLKTLAYQKIGSIGLSKPLIYFNEKGENKYGVIFGEGIWRWRLYDQAKTQSTANFEDLISKMINYLAIKDNKDPFKVELKNEYDENEKVVVKAELYNASYELINTPEVNFDLKDEASKNLSYHFYKTQDAYKLELGRLNEGIYTWTASTGLNGANYSKKGSFLVKEVKRELLNLTANHRMLNNISDNTNGQFFLPNEIDKLSDELLSREDIVSIVYQEKTFDDFIDYKWLFFLIVLLFSIEWFVRKFQGGY